MTEQKNDVLEIMKDLQPVAFLISMCLIVAAFYLNPENDVPKSSLTSILMASLSFFLVYIELFLFKKTDFLWFRYLGEWSLVGAAMLVLYALIGITKIIDEAALAINGLYLFVFYFPIFLITIMYLSGKVKKGKLYNFCEIFFHLSLFLFCSYIVLFLFKLLAGSQVSLPSWILVIVFWLLLITIALSLFPMVIFYTWELNLITKLKNVDTFNINPIVSLRTVISQIISAGLLVIGFWLLSGNPSWLLRVIAFFITCFCLIWYREIVSRVKSRVKQDLKHINDIMSLYLA
jgi:hypothetical protein